MTRAPLSLIVLLLTASCFGGNPRPSPGAGHYPAPVVTSPTGVRAESFVTSGIVDRGLDSGTRGRVDEAAGHLGLCLAELEAARVGFTSVPDKVMTDTCGLTGAGTLDVDRGTVARLRPAAPTMTCETALAFSIWRRQSVEPAAREIFGQDVVEVVHMGTYSCRSVSNRPGARPSAHSRAAAVDFAGVVLRDGRRIMVKDDWHGTGDGGADAARFLKRIRDDACRIFGTVLSPDYDAPHHDHLHLEPGGRAFCR